MPSSRGFTTSAVTALVCHARIKADEENSTFLFYFWETFFILSGYIFDSFCIFVWQDSWPF